VKVRPALVTTAGSVLAVVALGVALGAGSAPEAEEACNGSPELCERRYDDVVQGATHNSMSSPGVVDIWPEHDVDIRGQLDTGVRALLIDTHYWTELVSPEQLQGAGELLSSSEAQRLMATAAGRTGARDGTFLCHNHCVFGGMPFIEALADIRRFLDENPARWSR
jgi:hypothetical protein